MAFPCVDRHLKDAILNLFRGNRAMEDEARRHALLQQLRQFQSSPIVHEAGLENDGFGGFDVGSGPNSPDSYFQAVSRWLLAGSANLSSPLCMGHMSGPVPVFAGILSEFVSGLNQNLVKREASPALTVLERQTIARLHRLAFAESEEFYHAHSQNPESTLGLMTTGGTTANLAALWIARDTCFAPTEAFPGIEEAGIGAALAYHGYDGAVIVGSTRMHYSIDKAAVILGLGSRGVIRLPVDAENRLDTSMLRDCLSDCGDRRQRVLAVIGIAGATDCGSIDPLDQIATFAHSVGAFFHVDAAWGGPLLFSGTHRSKLAGIAQADSITIDAHKQMYVPVAASALLLKNPGIAKRIERRSHYMLQDGSGDLGRRSLEGSRNGAALFVHAALAIIGVDGFELLMDENLRKARVMAELIRGRADFELLFEPATNVVLYRYVPERLRSRTDWRLSPETNRYLNQFNEALQKAQSAAGRTFVSRTTLETAGRGRNLPIVALRAIIANPLLEEHHMQAVLEDQASIGAELAKSRELSPRV